MSPKRFADSFSNAEKSNEWPRTGRGRGGRGNARLKRGSSGVSLNRTSESNGLKRMLSSASGVDSNDDGGDWKVWVRLRDNLRGVEGAIERAANCRVGIT